LIQELGGSLLEFKQSKESEFAREGVDVLRGFEWERPSPDGTNIVSSVSILGKIVLAVSDASAVVSANRVCSLVVGAVEEDANILAALQQSRSMLDRGI